MEPRPPPHDRRSIAEFFQHVWGQALLTVTGAEDEAAKLLARVQGMAGWSQDEVKRQVRDYADKLTSQRREMERKVEDTVRVSLHRLRVPRKEEIAQLNSRLDTLHRRIEQLSK
ncbi:MAG: phasin family protein [Myxococcaceae bacterium]|jgi:poly(hydroxyalkanoate) granule-associated protein|nr:phasin family protein [Myxococcaceae bacterium]MCA3012739.1 phasin family protein [Myxococcaceae bacterium]